jgi:hypothetical protein
MLNNKHFYHKSIKNTIIAFGTLFSNIELKRFDKDNNIIQVQKVPVHYANQDRLLARAINVPDLETDTLVAQRYPQIAFSMTGLQYDSERKLNTLQKLYSCSSDGNNSTLVPVPYNLDFEVNILTISNDDALQIVEQILPYFTPSFTIKIVSIIGFPSVEVPITLDSINFSDTYSGAFQSDTREIIYTLRFTAKSNVFGSVVDNSGKIIKSVVVNLNTQQNSLPASILTVSPIAKTDLNNDNIVNQLDTTLLTATDDFGFDTRWLENF